MQSSPDQQLLNFPSVKQKKKKKSLPVMETDAQVHMQTLGDAQEILWNRGRKHCKN